MTLGDLVSRLCADIEAHFDRKFDELIATLIAHGATLEEIERAVRFQEEALAEGRERVRLFALRAWNSYEEEVVQ